MKLSLVPFIPVHASERAGIARLTAKRQTVRLGKIAMQKIEMSCARLYVQSIVKCSDRARCDTRFALTGIAEMIMLGCVRQINFVWQCNRTTIGMPQAIFRMHEDTERRRFQTFAICSPLLKRQIRLIPRIDRRPICGRRDIVNHVFRPLIEGVLKLIVVFLLAPRREVRPDTPPNIAHQHKNRGIRHDGLQLLGKIAFIPTLEAAAQRQPMPREQPTDIVIVLVGWFRHRSIPLIT